MNRINQLFSTKQKDILSCLLYTSDAADEL